MTLQAALRRFADAGFAACAIEASSIGIVEHRLEGTRIDVALFTNFTHDHLDYHGTMDAYWAAKAQLFAWPGLRAAVVNIDDARARRWRARCRRRARLWTYSARSAARLRAHAMATSTAAWLRAATKAQTHAAGAQRADRRLQRLATCWP